VAGLILSLPKDKPATAMGATLVHALAKFAAALSQFTVDHQLRR
jgi:hypothetical protein